MRFLKGLARQNVLGCGKHFPGLGSGQVDSHHATPLITKSFDLLWQEDMLPYRQAGEAIADGDGFACGVFRFRAEPASVSRYWITDILTRKIGYRGLIVSDDMEMGGILNYMGIADAAVRSLAAGMHVVEICRDPTLVFAAYEALLREAESSPAFARLLRRAAARAQALQPKVLKDEPAPTSSALSKMRSAVEHFTEQVARAGRLPGAHFDDGCRHHERDVGRWHRRCLHPD